MVLGEFTKALKGTGEIEITVTGRASGRKISSPVWFVQDWVSALRDRPWLMESESRFPGNPQLLNAATPDVALCAAYALAVNVFTFASFLGQC